MKILMVSKGGDGASLLNAMKDEGHDVRLLLAEPEVAKTPLYQGIVERVPSEAWARAWKPDLVFADMAKSGEMMDRFRKAGIPVLGGGVMNDTIELERKTGIEMAQACGIPVPEWQYARSFPEAIRKVKEFDGGVAVKFDMNQPTNSSMCCDTPEDMVAWLQDQERQKLLDPTQGIVIQEKIEGVEVSCEGWWTGKALVAVNSTMEEKSAGAGGCGSKLGCAGNIVWRWPEGTPLVAKTLEKIVPWLQAHDYPPGPIDGNFICRGGKPYFLEWSPRIGYDAIFAFCELLNLPMGEFFAGVAKGTLAKAALAGGYASAVRAGIPPWPFEPTACSPAVKAAFSLILKKECFGVPIDGPVDEHVWLGDVMLNEEGDFVCAGTSGQVFACSSAGATPEAANLSVVQKIESFHTRMRTLYWRNDTHERVAGDLQKLKQQGLT